MSSNDPLWEELSGRLPSFVGGRHEENQYAEDVRVVGQILSRDFTRMSLQNILTGIGYPGRPLARLIALREVGKGRVVYIAAHLDANLKEQPGDPMAMEVLQRAIRWAGRDGTPLKTNCPASVEVLVYSTARRMVILLLNQTTNQYINDPIRYVVPVEDIEVAVKLGASAPKQISSLSDQNPKGKIANGWLTVGIGQLAEREAVMVNLPTQ